MPEQGQILDVDQNNRDQEKFPDRVRVQDMAVALHAESHNGFF